MKVKHLQPPLFVFGLIVLAVSLTIIVKQTFRREVPSIEQAVQTVQTGDFKLSSPAFDSNTTIPAVYTCKGANVNPPLLIENPPGNAKEFVLIVRDRDAQDSNSVHWLLWNVPVETTAITEHAIPEGSIQGVTDFGSDGYSGPCPANNTGTHHYIFEIYALNDSLSLDASTKRDAVVAAMNGKVITKTQLTGTVTSDTSP